MLCSSEWQRRMKGECDGNEQKVCWTAFHFAVYSESLIKSKKFEFNFKSSTICYILKKYHRTDTQMPTTTSSFCSRLLIHPPLFAYPCSCTEIFLSFTRYAISTVFMHVRGDILKSENLCIHFRCYVTRSALLGKCTLLLIWLSLLVHWAELKTSRATRNWLC